MPPTLARLDVGDEPDLWTDLGFETIGDRCRLGSVDVILTGPEAGRGIHAWTWREADEGAVVGDIPTSVVASPEPLAAEPHPNGAVALFYVVLFGPSWSDAADAMASIGVDAGVGRPMGRQEPVMLRSLAPAGRPAIELIGPVEPDQSRGWRLWGAIVEVLDIDATAEWLGPRLRPAKQAVQQGRRIATLDRSAGSSVALAFMGPDEGA